MLVVIYQLFNSLILTASIMVRRHFYKISCPHHDQSVGNLRSLLPKKSRLTIVDVKINEDYKDVGCNFSALKLFNSYNFCHGETTFL